MSIYIGCHLSVTNGYEAMGRTMLALGGRTTDPELALEIVKTFMDTEFEGGRHKRRTDMLDEM